MKALSIKQPWASLIATPRQDNPLLGIKDIENRTWKTHFRGRIYIHASASKVKFDNWYDSPLNNEQLLSLDPMQYGLDFEYSAIIGEVDIVDCVINHPSIWAEKTFTYEYDESGEKPIGKPIYNWVLANPVLYDKPILNVKGKLSFWEFEKKQSVCNYCLEFVDELVDGFGCENCNKKYK